MICRINKYGSLVMKRGDVFKEQHCPYREGYSFCGDACPLFEYFGDLSGVVLNCWSHPKLILFQKKEGTDDND